MVTENDRTLKAFRALRDGNTELLESLRNASHESLRDDYEVSSPELDTMVEIAWRHEAALVAHDGRRLRRLYDQCCPARTRSRASAGASKRVSGGYDIDPDIWAVKADEGTREEMCQKPERERRQLPARHL